MKQYAFRPNRLRRLLALGRADFGTALRIPSIERVEIFGFAGYDFVMFDGELGAALTPLPQLLLASDAAELTSIVRVPERIRAMVLPPLEFKLAARRCCSSMRSYSRGPSCAKRDSGRRASAHSLVCRGRHAMVSAMSGPAERRQPRYGAYCPD